MKRQSTWNVLSLENGIKIQNLRKLIKNGFKVIGTYDTEFEENATNLSKEFSSEKLTLKSLDLSSRNDLKSFVDDIVDPIDAFVFAQFYFDMENPDDFNHEIWDRSIAINLTASNYLIHELKNKMNVGSSIVILTSTEGFRGSYGALAYAATKAAIHNLVKTLANNLGKPLLFFRHSSYFKTLFQNSFTRN